MIEQLILANTQKLSSMTVTTNTDLLFDDVSMLKQVIGQNPHALSSPVSDCDCSSYYSIEDDETFDTHQVTEFAAQAG
ncbi:hypothetical protein EQG79_26600 [Spirosoma sordidisoli]|uniref:Uncharacterized protein n=1 Tax=Spirosoma sordidisoli TaxID=2502893 RepID=A0A4Q2UHL6_9BACT|nr:hypothetical protein EQG79_26600 [Spirosoma sordidisoli]